MRATPISLGGVNLVKAFQSRQMRRIQSGAARLRWLAVAGWVWLVASLWLANAEQSAPSPAERAAETGRLCEAARQRYQAQTTNSEAAWQFARACFDAAEAATNNPIRAGFAEEGIAACRQLLPRAPDCAPGHYYLGMNLGQLADTKRNLAGLKLVDGMEREFKTARDLDEHFDFAGPDRNLGLLYAEAPALISIGSRSKARKHLERAVELAPEFPENRLNLAEAYAKWHDKKLLQRELDALEKLWPAAQTNFAGADWSAAWPEWRRRLDQLRGK